MAEGEGGFYFDFPQAPGSVHYVTRKATGDGRASVHMRFKLIGDGALVPTEGDPPAKVRSFIQRAGDNLSGAGEFEHYRFWSDPTELTSSGEFTIDVPLDPDRWTSVYGQHNALGFSFVLANLDNVGFTFGGMFAGHGVYTTGQARFVLLEFEIR